MSQRMLQQIPPGFQSAVAEPRSTWAQSQLVQRRTVQDYTLMDDLFMSVVLSDTLACQYVLRVILQEPDLLVHEVTSQKVMPQLYGKSPRLDVTAETPDGRIMNIEVQQQPETDYGRRLRFYTGTMVTKLLERGVGYDKLPDQIMIYIGTSDIWHRGRTIYEFQMTEIHDGFQVNDGLREIFVNTAVNDGSAIAALMAYFKTADPWDMNHGDLSKQVHYQKIDKKGDGFMSSLAQQLFDEGLEKGLAIAVYALMQHQNCTQDAAMNILDIQPQDRQAIAALLAEKQSTL